MATLWITEYRRVESHDFGAGSVPVAKEPAEAEEALTYSTAAQSAAFSAHTYFIRMISDGDCHVKFGANPTATTSHQKLTADVEYWRAVRPGHKVSAVAAS